MKGILRTNIATQTTVEHSKRTRKPICTFVSFVVAVLLAVTCPSFQRRATAQDLFGGPPHSIAFQSNRDGNNEIYVMNPDGSDQTRLTFDSRNDQRPDISPNGEQIVFSSNRITAENPEGDFEIFIMDSDGSDVRQLSFNAADDSWPRWSPNRKWIAFHSNVDGNYEIYVVRPDGTDLTRVTDYPGLDQYPEWSPNGRQLAIRRDLELYLIDKDGSNPVQLTFTTPPAFNQMASWSPDGKQLAFLSTREGYASVFVMDVDGSDRLTLRPDQTPLLRGAAGHPGGHEMGSTYTSPVVVPKSV
jgi:Tol biopolymer transport system component